MENIETILFENLNQSEKKKFLEKSNSFETKFKKGEYVFREGESPEFLFILIRGGVQVEKLDFNGKRMIINKFTKNGTVFGEVYLYLESEKYDYSCMATEDSKVLFIPKSSMLLRDDLDELSIKINNNMLQILSEKAYTLNEKILVIGSFTLREKILKFLMQKSNHKPYIKLDINREEMADFIGVTRPSLSRELMKMQSEGLISLDGNKVIINEEKVGEYI